MGACENQLHENETKESLIDLYVAALDEIRDLKKMQKRAIGVLRDQLHEARGFHDDHCATGCDTPWHRT